MFQQSPIQKPIYHYHNEHNNIQYPYSNSFLFQQPNSKSPQQLNQTQPLPHTYKSSTKPIQNLNKVQSNRSQSSSKANIESINKDLLQLKEQLKKITDKNIQINKNYLIGQNIVQTIKQNSAEKQSPRVNIPEFRFQPLNLNKKMTNRDMIVAQSQHKAKDIKPKNTQIIEPPSKRGKINSFMHVKQNKQKSFLHNEQLKNAQYLMNPLEFYQKQQKTQLPQLKQKLLKISSQLQVIHIQKQSLLNKLKNKQIQNDNLNIQLKRLNKYIYDNKISSLLQNNDKIIINKLQNQLQKLRKNQHHNLDQFIIQTLEENKLLKFKLQEKEQSSRQTNDKLKVEGRINEQLKQQIIVLELRFNSELKAKQKRIQIQLNDKANQIKTYKNTLQTLILKYQSAITQIKQKDSFIANYILSRSQQQQKKHYKTVLQKYQINFPQNLTVNTFLMEQIEIDRLKKEVQRLKSKIN